MNKVKLIVFEGADGSGKTTQAKLLLKFLKSQKIPTAYISFPRYQQSLWGGMVKRYLLGEFGKLDQVDPYLASLPYAGDRMTAASQLTKWLDEGKIVVCNRYIGSNMAHMAAKIKNQKSKIEYISWLEKLEYEENKIPKEDLVIFLSVPVEVSRNLIKGRKLDIHEADLNYLSQVLETYEMVFRKKNYWEKVECTKDGKLLTPTRIHQKVLEILKKYKLFFESV